MSVSSTRQLRENFNSFITDHFDKALGALTNQQKTEGLIRFYIEKIHNRRHELIDNEAIEKGLVDGSSDLGADFIHKDGNHVLILQSKFHGGTHSRAVSNDILNFQNCLNRLSEPPSKWKGNRKLQDVLDLLDFKNDEFSLYFLCLGKIEGQAKTQSDEQVNFELEGLSDRVNIEYWDERKIAEEYRTAAKIEEPTDLITGTLCSAPSSTQRTPIVKIETKNGLSYILITEAKQVIEFYKKWRDKLFSLNIREYVGYTRNNKEIQKTAEEQPDNFFLFNNGISCLAKNVEMDPSSSKLSIKGFQVINGAQTVKALVKASRNFGSNQPLILVRITEIGQNYEEEGKLRERIIRYNNTQTTIKPADFRSNDPIQNDLKKKFEKLTKNGKRVHYMNKRTDPQNDSGVIKIKMEDFAKVIYAFLGDSTEVERNPNLLFDAEKEGYKTVFGNGEEIYEGEMPNEAFQLRACIWWISDTFEQQRKEDKKVLQDTVALKALQRKWLLLYTARVLLEKKLGENRWKDWLCKGYKGDWEFRKDRFGKSVGNLYDVSKRMLKMRYKEDSKRADFEHRNWFRKKDVQEGLSDFIEDSGVHQLNLE